jgi:hypothetical protein
VTSTRATSVRVVSPPDSEAFEESRYKCLRIKSRSLRSVKPRPNDQKNPSAHFGASAHVVTDESLSLGQKKAALDQLELDARLLQKLPTKA